LNFPVFFAFELIFLPVEFSSNILHHFPYWKLYLKMKSGYSFAISSLFKVCWWKSSKWFINSFRVLYGWISGILFWKIFDISANFRVQQWNLLHFTFTVEFIGSFGNLSFMFLDVLPWFLCHNKKWTMK
jgi:hypothetical protein